MNLFFLKFKKVKTLNKIHIKILKKYYNKFKEIKIKIKYININSIVK